MLTQISKPVKDIIDGISENALVLDVGGGISPFARADYVMDYVDFEKVRFDKVKGEGNARVTKETYIKHDICSREPWPVKDKQFDYSICSHTLEDIRDPLWVCSELIRVSKAGYIEIPSRLYETTFNIEMKNMAGNSHHRWIIDIKDNALRFTLKHAQVHFRAINKNNRRPQKGPEEILQIEWKDSFPYFENFLENGQEVFEYFANKPISEKEKWSRYRHLDPRNYFVAWVSYFKNTNKTFGNIFARLRK